MSTRSRYVIKCDVCGIEVEGPTRLLARGLAHRMGWSFGRRSAATTRRLDLCPTDSTLSPSALQDEARRRRL